jgi:hypothetical protein
MAEALGIASSVISLIQLTGTIVNYGIDFYSAGKDREDEKAKLESLQPVIEQVSRRLQDAIKNPSTPWNQVVLKFLKDGKGRPESPLTKLDKIVQDLVKKDGGSVTIKQRFLWSWAKTRLDAKFAEIDTHITRINFALSQAHFELDLNTNTSVGKIDTHVERIESEVQNINATLSQEQKARLEKEETKLRRAIQSWLSPLEFLDRQKDLVDKCFPTGEPFLESEEFLAWTEGQSWHLRCFGDTGTGKVSL